MTGKSLAKQPSGLVPRDELRELLNKFLEEGEDDRFVWETITTRNGLPHNWIYDLFQDRNGNIWVGTWGGGAALFDGKSWRTFTKTDGLPSLAVTCFAEDQEGTIWAATDAGLCVFDGKGFIEAGLSGKSLLHIVFDRVGNLWAGCWRMNVSGGGLFRYDGRDWRTFSKSDGLPGMEILKIFEDSKGRIWVGTYDRGIGAGVGCFDGKAWRAYNSRDGLIDNCVYSMFEDPDGHLWFGTIGGVSIRDVRRKKWHRLTTLDGLADDHVYCMIIDSRKKMWFGTEAGVSRYDGTTWKSFAKADGLVENLVRAILEDRDGNIWFGTYPYQPGAGGISIARFEKGPKSLAEKLTKFLPRDLDRKLLGPPDRKPPGRRT